MTQRPDDDPVPSVEPPVYGTPDPEGPPPPPPPPPPGLAAPGYGEVPTTPIYSPPPVDPPVYPAPPGPSSYQQPPPAPPVWGQPPGGTPPSSRWGHPGGTPTPGPLTGGGPEERQWALFAHLGGVLAYFPVIHLLPALAIYSIYQSRSEYVRDQAREALNFQIFVLIAYFVARILNVLPLFPNLVVLVWLFSLVFSVLAAVAASRGQRYRYPLTYRFLT